MRHGMISVGKWDERAWQIPLRYISQVLTNLPQVIGSEACVFWHCMSIAHVIFMVQMDVVLVMFIVLSNALIISLNCCVHSFQ